MTGNSVGLDGQEVPLLKSLLPVFYQPGPTGELPPSDLQEQEQALPTECMPSTWHLPGCGFREYLRLILLFTGEVQWSPRHIAYGEPNS